ncbi:M20/M25/M40 family metallo-hydrolase [Sphingomonas sp. dw_22]|uniref:M20/M25/M40 family metallo-hydrolase n=1 Tax=Sphingomonas sp. dw_22 TaxID=2721175 RepID=UPI001BD4F19F|nr:M20/M25/M40 family metallo-hydrolase [Sphingomonas sp. dw_22]
MRPALLLAALSLGLAPVAALAQSASDEPAFKPEEVRAHIEFLADDALEGRDAGTRGYTIAARYVASRFRALGLQPGGPDGSWYQQVPLAEYALDASKPATLTIGGKSFANGTDILMGGTPRGGGGTQTLTANAVFVGYGLDAPKLGHDDYAGVDVAGKFAVMLMALPTGLPDAPALMNKRGDIAAAHGAIGVIYLVGDGEQTKAFPWTAANGYYARPQTSWLTPEGTPPGIDPRIQIGFYANDKVARALFAGSPIDPDTMFSAAKRNDALPHSAPLAARLTAARTSKVKWMTSPNVMGLLPGSDPALSREVVLLTAHLDHEGLNPELKGDQIYNGAMDNAAGTAAMLEAARGFAQSGRRPKRSILFVSLTAEEDGLLGSDYLAHYPVAADGKVVADVNLDMPILLYDFQDVVAFGAEHSTLGPIVERAAAKMGVALSPDPMPEEQLFVRSDHYSFVKAGVPSVFLVTGFRNGGEKAFRDFLKTHYHKVSDQADLPFDWAAGAKFARINYLIAREIADAPEAPRWYAGNAFGDRFAPDASKAPRPAK